MFLCGNNQIWWKIASNYALPLCDHIENLLSNPYYSVDKNLLSSLREILIHRQKEDELKNFKLIGKRLGSVGVRNEKTENYEKMTQEERTEQEMVSDIFQSTSSRDQWIRKRREEIKEQDKCRDDTAAAKILSEIQIFQKNYPNDIPKKLSRPLKRSGIRRIFHRN